MRKKSNVERLSNVLTGLSWFYDSLDTVIVSKTSFFNISKFLEELEIFKNRCIGEFAGVTLSDLIWDENKGALLHFEIDYNHHSEIYKRFTKLIEIIENNKVFEENTKEVVITEECEMEIENLIHLNFASKDIYETILKTKHDERIKETLVRNLEKVRDSFEVEWNTSVYRIAEKLRNERENKLKFIK